MDFTDTTGHIDLIQNGFDYQWTPHQPANIQRNAQRATLNQFQTYPANMVEGRATLVDGGAGFYPGKYWRVLQPAQVYQNQQSILADMLGGGMMAGNLVNQPLIQGFGG